ncbi:hypothetical protein CC78DRAFT_577719 [Lojkania enalia]|uniref:Uncharacterized protein n=1 Tax=Lojkania enalia TaxID=147567 RepID=A0A9P4KCM7_9PLEO|nr:hypothetical protein CC78DRAFT_577719 [Didymosphaeria enalia]
MRGAGEVTPAIEKRRRMKTWRRDMAVCDVGSSGVRGNQRQDVSSEKGKDRASCAIGRNLCSGKPDSASHRLARMKMCKGPGGAHGETFGIGWRCSRALDLPSKPGVGDQSILASRMAALSPLATVQSIQDEVWAGLKAGRTGGMKVGNQTINVVGQDWARAQEETNNGYMSSTIHRSPNAPTHPSFPHHI